MREIFDMIQATRALSPVAAAPTDNVAMVSQIIDTKGFGSVVFLIVLGSLADTDATFTTLVEDGDNSALSDNAAVADAYLLGTEAAGYGSFTFAEDNKVIKIGYRGPKRYVRLTITPVNNTGNACIAVVAVQCDPRDPPYSTQQV